MGNKLSLNSGTVYSKETTFNGFDNPLKTSGSKPSTSTFTKSGVPYFSIILSNVIISICFVSFHVLPTKRVSPVLIIKS